MSIKSIIEFVIQSIVYNIYFKGGFIVMNNFVITCCSTVDLEKEYLEKGIFHMFVFIILLMELNILMI